MTSQQQRSISYAITTAIVVLVVDQLLKLSIRDRLLEGETQTIIPGFELTHLEDSGVAFGLFAGSGAVLVSVGLVALVGLALYLSVRTSSTFAWVSFGLLLGGATSNLIDRIGRGSVTDYLDPDLWPAFNLADVAIVIGVVGLAVDALTAERARDDC